MFSREAAAHPTDDGRALGEVTGLLAGGTFSALSGFSSRAAYAFALVTLIWAAPAGGDQPAEGASPCPEKGNVVAVNARRRELWLCKDGAAMARFQVAIGRGGVDKHTKGDGRTPLGTYTLGSPRSSRRYGVFIPIDYPTPDQSANGFTGSDVGIHGPPRGLTEPEYPTTAVDWTQGCIATGGDPEIGAIAEFVREWQPVLVVW